MIYNIFISHSWDYSDNYYRLIRLLNSDPSFHFKDYSAPRSYPIENARTQYELEDAIARKIQPVSCVVVIAGIYATYSKWIETEIRIAKRMNKRIIAVEPYGSQKTSSFVKQNADVIVRWNSKSIVDAIRGH